MNFMHRFALFFLAAISASHCIAQSPSAAGIVKGEIQGAGGLLANEDVMVSLYDATGHVTERGFASRDGGFELRVPAGSYLLRLESGGGETITQENITVFSGLTPVIIRLPERKKESSASGTVSADQLRHPVPKKAFQAFADGQRDFQAGHYAKAADALRKAIAIDPQFGDAHLNLGATYMRLGDPKSAEEETRLAIASGGPMAAAYGNLAYLLSLRNAFGEAEDAARKAVQADSSNHKAHFLLGALLARKPDKRQEALKELRLAGSDVPSASRMIEQLCQAGCVP